MAQIDPLSFIALFHLIGNVIQLRGDALGPLVGNIVIVQRQGDFHARRPVFAKDLDNPARGHMFPGRLHRDRHQDHLPVLGAAGLFFGDDDVLTDSRIVRSHEVDTTLLEVAAHQFGGALLHHLDNGTFRPALVIPAGDAHQHHVAIEDPAHLPTGKEDVVASALAGGDKAKTVRMTDYPALLQIHLVQGAETAPPVADQLAVPDHGDQTAAQGLDAVLVPQI